VHLVGGKLDLVLQNPSLRAVPFEQVCAYAAENLDDISSLGDDLSCHEVSAKDDTGSFFPQIFLIQVSRRYSWRFRESWWSNERKSRMQEMRFLDDGNTVASTLMTRLVQEDEDVAVDYMCFRAVGVRISCTLTAHGCIALGVTVDGVGCIFYGLHA